MLRDDLDRLDGEGFFGVLGEHGYEDVVDDLDFRLVESCDFNEDVSGMDANLGVVSVDDWGKGAYRSFGVEDNRVNWRLSYYMQIASKVFIILKNR